MPNFSDLIAKTAAQRESARKNSEEAKNIAEQNTQKPKAEEKITKEDQKNAGDAAKEKRKKEKQAEEAAKKKRKKEAEKQKKTASQRPDNSTQVPKIVLVKSPVQIPKEVKPTEEHKKRVEELTEEILEEGAKVGKVFGKDAPTESDIKALENNKNVFAKGSNHKPSSGIKSWYLKHREQVPIFGTIATGLLFAGLMALVVATSVVALPVGIVAAIFIGFTFGVVTGGISFGILYGCGPRSEKKKEITLIVGPEKKEVSENQDEKPAPGVGPAAATTVHPGPTSASKALRERQGNHPSFSGSCREEAEKPSTQIPSQSAFVS